MSRRPALKVSEMQMVLLNILIVMLCIRASSQVKLKLSPPYIRESTIAVEAKKSRKST